MRPSVIAWPAQQIESIAPDFTLPLLNGMSRSLQSFLTGSKGIVVVFWSGVCSHCRRYDTYLNQLSERYSDLGTVIVASRQDESAQALWEMLADRGLHFPILHDIERTVAHAWLVQQTPRVFLLDAQRRLVYRGAIDNFKYPQDPDYRAYLDMAIEAFLAGQAPLRPETPSFGCPIESIYYSLPKR